MKRTGQALFRHSILLKALVYLSGFRSAIRVTEVMVFSSPYYGETEYYVCPRCGITIEREFMHFCDRCGQKLDWKDFQKAKKVYSSSQKAHI